MVTILVATDQEYALAKKYLQGFSILKTGVGAGNIIRTCYAMPESTDLINIGFCGSNTLPIGTVTEVSRTFRNIDHTVGFVDYRNGFQLSENGYDCYTDNDFVTENQHDYPVVYDMELNYIAAFPYRLLGAIKIVSDNLDLDEYAKTIHNSEAETWAKVKKLVYDILAHKGK